MRQSAPMKKNMKLEDILAKNITDLMATTMGLDTIDKVAQRSGVGRGTVDRVRKAEVSTKIETLELLANAFSVTPIALLSEDRNESGAVSAPAETYSTTAGQTRTVPTSLQWISKDEDELLSAYRGTDDEGRRTLLNIASIVPKVLLGIFRSDQAE